VTKLPASRHPNGSTTPSILDDPSVFTALGDPSLKSLKTVLRGVLPRAQPRVREKIASCLHLLATGHTWKTAEDKSGTSWHMIQSCKARSKDFADLYNVAEASRDAVRQAQRVDAMQTRGVKGWEEPVWYKGVQVGTVRKFSDKLLELGLKAGEPDKYSDRHQAAVNLDVAIVFQEYGVPTPEAQRPTIDVTGHIREESPAEPENPRPKLRPGAKKGENPNE